MKHILIANDLLQGGGVEKLMFDFVLHWCKQFKITILTEYKEHEFYNIYPKQVKYLHYHPKNNLEYICGLRKLGKLIKYLYRQIVFLSIRIKAFDVAIAMKEGSITKYIGKTNAKVKLGWVHTDYYNAYWTNMVFKNTKNELKCMKVFNHIICVSNTIKESIKGVIGDPQNLVVRYNPIDVEKIRKLSKEKVMDDIILYPTNKPIFISIGRLHYQKGYDLLLEACEKLELDSLEYELWIIGSGKDEKVIKELCMTKQLKNVKFLGEMKNPYSFLGNASWFISSSRYEGYSLVTQEAAVLGIPIIATECSGVRELLGDNSEYGVIVDITVDSLYAAMKKVIKTSDLHETYQELIKSRANIINFDERINSITELFCE